VAEKLFRGFVFIATMAPRVQRFATPFLFAQVCMMDRIEQDSMDEQDG